MEPGAVRLSVVLPAYREAPRIATTVERVRAAIGALDAEVIVVDDGSQDATAERAAAAGARVVAHAANQGKGAAVRTGALAARGRVVAFTDADLSYPPDQLRELLARVEDGWDVVVGSRAHDATETVVAAGAIRAVSTHAFNLLTRVALGSRHRDTQCGLKAFNADAARALFGLARIDGFAFDVELLHIAALHRLSVLEVPVRVSNSATSTVRLGRDSYRMVRDVLRVRQWSRAGAYSVSHEEARQPVA